MSKRPYWYPLRSEHSREGHEFTEAMPIATGIIVRTGIMGAYDDDLDFGRCCITAVFIPGLTVDDDCLEQDDRDNEWYTPREIVNAR